MTSKKPPALWVMRIDGGALPEEQQRELDAWLEADTRHLGAFVRAQAVWVDMDRVAALRGRSRPRQGARRTVALAACCGNSRRDARTARSSGGRQQPLPGRPREHAGRRSASSDARGRLGARSQYGIRAAGEVRRRQRRVVLREGEASFQVAHDEQRPFIVQAGDVSVRAVGTAFSVRMRPSGVEVIVTEGVVEVMRDGATERVAAERVARNQEVVVATAEQPITVAALSEPEVQRRLSWQDGRLVFQGEALADGSRRGESLFAAPGRDRRSGARQQIVRRSFPRRRHARVRAGRGDRVRCAVARRKRRITSARLEDFVSSHIVPGIEQRVGDNMRYRRCRGSRSALLALVLSSVLSGAAFAQQKQNFDIPAEAAPAAIQRWAQQSGLQVFAAEDDLRGIRTNRRARRLRARSRRRRCWSQAPAWR